MTTFNLSIDLSDVINADAILTAELFPRLHEAVGAVAEATRTMWIDDVMKARGIWSVEKQRYANSIRWEYSGEFGATIFSDYAIADQIEKGRPARDIKDMLNTSSKVRTTQSGKRFLVIPIRHNTPGNEAHASAMPESVYAIASGMKKSHITGQGKRASGEVTLFGGGMKPAPPSQQKPYMTHVGSQSPYMVTRHQYEWKERVTKAQIRQAGLSKAQQRRYSGMVRMNTSSGAQNSSAYMTFRIMMEGQQGWVIPEQAGKWIAQGVTKRIMPVAREVFAQAIKMDVMG